MKIPTFLRLPAALPLAGAALLAASAPAPTRAATVTSGGVTTVAAGGIAPGASTDYDFFGTSDQPRNLSTFSLTSVGNQVSGTPYSYSSLQAPGGGSLFKTGLVDNPGQVGTSNLATFTVKSGALTNQSYSVYVLFGNSDQNTVSDRSIGLSIDGATPTTVAITDASTTNDFLRFNVTGLNPGDTLTFSATTAAMDAHGNSIIGPYLGGVTFADVPEPATWTGGLGVLGAGLLGRRHRGRAA